MKTFAKIILAILFLCFSIQLAIAAHIVGGDVTYQCISSNSVTKTTKFKVTFTMYRDIFGGGANFDFGASFGVFSKVSGFHDWRHYKTITADPIDITGITFEEECVIVPPNIGVERANYIFEVELPWGFEAFQIVYQRCCRNASISNIIAPGETGAAFFVEILRDAVENCNNSPTFKKFPPLLICSNKPFSFDHSAIDVDGDKLVYEFCAPISAGGIAGQGTGDPTSCVGVRPNPVNCPPPFPEITFIAPYSGTNPLGSPSNGQINSTTGIITGTPNLTGQFVVGICVKEYRNNVLIGTIRRDFQFNIHECKGIELVQNYKKCPDASITVNDSTYTLEGTFRQILASSNGCDSTLVINISNHITYNIEKEYALCDGDTLTVNGQRYIAAGLFIQDLLTKDGCDSTLNIKVSKINPSTAELAFKKCDFEVIKVNNVEYDSFGQFTQTFTNSVGCDSTLHIFVSRAEGVSSEHKYKLCDDDILVLNGTTYDQAGQYKQELKTILGCDSTIHINISKFFSKETVLNYSLCNSPSIEVNNEVYTAVGQYTQTLMTQEGCDSVLVINIIECDNFIKYNFENCDALTNDASMIYEEFTPIYDGNGLNCGTAIASNVYRIRPSQNKHSCTQGLNGSIAMCVSSHKACNLNTIDEDKAITFDLKLRPNADANLQFSSLSFYHKAALNYNWIGGNSGLNNYPTKFEIIILKDGIELYKEVEVATNNDWTEKKIVFTSNNAFVTDKETNFQIKLIPYCIVGNASDVTAWDIDDVSIATSCVQLNNRQVTGKVLGFTGKNAIITRTSNDHIVTSQKVSANGSFSFKNNRADSEYTFTVENNENVKEGITTTDLLLIRKHILEIEKFINPCNTLAADVNNDSKITVSDMVELRKLLLGLTDKFANNSSWKFVNNSQCMEGIKPNNIEEFIKIEPSAINQSIEFRAIKIGDVNRN